MIFKSPQLDERACFSETIVHHRQIFRGAIRLLTPKRNEKQKLWQCTDRSDRETHRGKLNLARPQSLDEISTSTDQTSKPHRVFWLRTSSTWRFGKHRSFCCSWGLPPSSRTVRLAERVTIAQTSSLSVGGIQLKAKK